MGRPPRIYRHVEPDKWFSADYRALSKPKPSGQQLWDYLLHSPRGCAIPGVILATSRVMASDLEWSDRAFAKVMAEIVGRGMAEVDEKAGLVVLTKALIADGHARETNAPSSIKSVVTWVRALARLPICQLRNTVAARLSLFFQLLGGQFPKAFADAMADSCTQTVAVRESPLVHQGAGSREQGSSFSPGHAPARDPSTPAPVPMATGTEPDARPVFAPLAAYVTLAVGLLNAARLELDPAAQPVDADQGDEMAAAAHLRTLPEDRREAAIRHGVAAIAASVKAGRDEITALRPGELFGPRSWRKWQAAPTEFTARGRDGPGGFRAPSRAPPTRGSSAGRALVARLEAEEAARSQEPDP